MSRRKKERNALDRASKELAKEADIVELLKMLRFFKAFTNHYAA